LAASFTGGHRFPSVPRFGGSVVRGYAVWGCEAPHA